MSNILQLQGWAVHISWCADHTYVACPDLKQYFECWGKHYTPPDQVYICSGQGNYAVANCYRRPVNIAGTWYADTAGIGMYAVNGVCHQSANCFLITTGRTLNLNVRGYWLSVLMYGTYGTAFWLWLPAVLTPCLISAGAAAPGATTGEQSLPQQIQDLYTLAQQEAEPPSQNEMLIREAALVTRFYAPDIDPAKFADLHAALLADKDEAIASGATGEALAAKLNDVAARYQELFAKRLGPDAYERLMGIPPGEIFKITEPEAEPAAGIKLPDSKTPA